MAIQSLRQWPAIGSAYIGDGEMDARTRKLMRMYRIEKKDAQALVDAGLDTPRKIKAELGNAKLPRALKDKVKR